MFRRPTPPASRFRPLNPWDQEDERLGLAPLDPAPTIRKPFKPLNERLLDARKARSAELARQPGKLPDSLGQPAPTGQADIPRRPRLSLPQPHQTQPTAPKTQGGLVADIDATEFDYPLINLAVEALTQALGHRPKPGETIPAGAASPISRPWPGTASTAARMPTSSAMSKACIVRPSPPPISMPPGA